MSKPSARGRRWPFLALLAFLVAALVATGCGGDDDEGQPAAGELKTIEQGKLKVGSDIPYKPFEFGRAPDYEGFDIDIVNDVAKRIDLEVEIVKTPFDPIFRNLAQGRFDMVASSTTITPERERTVDFSIPYFPADQSLAVKKGSDIRTVDDVDGEVVGAQLGTTGADYAKDETKAESVRTYDLIDDAYKALQAGQVAAVITDFPVSKYAEREKPELQVVETIPTGEQYGLGFAKESDALREAVNDALNEMKGDGTYTKIYRKWFEVDPPESILKTDGQT
jgi:ABC-type amino acid transport substrate-binding protein